MVNGMLEQAISQNASVAIDQETYQAQFHALVDRFEKAKARREVVDTRRKERKAMHDALNRFLAEMRTGQVITEFSSELWMATVDKVTMHINRQSTFRFKNGTEITV